MTRPSRPIEILVRERASGRCEYCLLPEPVTDTPFQIDHIIAEKHGGATVLENLAFSCFYCNTYKGPNIAGLDPATGTLCRLFNPRSDSWTQHFCWNGPRLEGLSDVGRTTIQVLLINHPEALAARKALIADGSF